MPVGAECFRDRWARVVASKRGPPSATTRHVLLTLAVHMKCSGADCFPSIQTIAEETALSERAVKKHLRTAEEEGWIHRTSRGINGQGWRRMKYLPLMPDAVNGVHHVEHEGGEADAPPSPKGGERPAPRSPEGGERRSRKVVNEVHPNQEENQEGTTTAAEEELDAFLSRTNAEWGLESKTPSEWLADLDVGFPRSRLPLVLRAAGDWYEEALATGKKKAPPKRPTTFLRNWFRTEARDHAASNGGPTPPTEAHVRIPGTIGSAY